MKGVIEKVWQSKTKGKDKKDYWVLTIGGERYSVWEPEYMKGIQEGSTVEYESAQSGEFKKITKIGVVEAAPPSKYKPPVKAGYKDQQIVRMACLKSAAVLVSGSDNHPVDKGGMTLDLARRFEKYVVEEDIEIPDIGTGRETHEREPGEDG